MSGDLYVGYDPSRKGCTYTGCGRGDTATVDGIRGRRCAEHPPEFSPKHQRLTEEAGNDPGPYLRTAEACRLSGSPS